jgi:hypothetical protein
MSQVLLAFELLDFTMLRPVLFGARFEKREPFTSIIFQFILVGGRGAAVNSAY